MTAAAAAAGNIGEMMGRIIEASMKTKTVVVPMMIQDSGRIRQYCLLLHRPAIFFFFGGRTQVLLTTTFIKLFLLQHHNIIHPPQ